MGILSSVIGGFFGQPSAQKPPAEQTAPSPPAAASRPPPVATPPQQIVRSPSDPTARNIRELGLLFAGFGFMAASIAVTRRSVIRRKIESFPRFYSSNMASLAMESGERSFMAVQALGLATVNVMSFGIMLTGGISWAFDLCNMSELRERTQRALRTPGAFSEEDEKELERMMGGILEKLGMQVPEEGEQVNPEKR